TAPESYTGFQGEGGTCRRQGRSDIGAACRAVPIKPTSTRCPSVWQPTPAETPLSDAEILFRTGALHYAFSLKSKNLRSFNWIIQEIKVIIPSVILYRVFKALVPAPLVPGVKRSRCPVCVFIW